MGSWRKKLLIDEKSRRGVVPLAPVSRASSSRKNMRKYYHPDEPFRSSYQDPPPRPDLRLMKKNWLLWFAVVATILAVIINVGVFLSEFV
jgi:hypothetical protein